MHTRRHALVFLALVAASPMAEAGNGFLARSRRAVRPRKGVAIVVPTHSQVTSDGRHVQVGLEIAHRGGLLHRLLGRDLKIEQTSVTVVPNKTVVVGRGRETTFGRSVTFELKASPKGSVTIRERQAHGLPSPAYFSSIGGYRAEILRVEPKDGALEVQGRIKETAGVPWESSILTPLRDVPLEMSNPKVRRYQKEGANLARRSRYFSQTFANVRINQHTEAEIADVERRWGPDVGSLFRERGPWLEADQLEFTARIPADYKLRRVRLDTFNYGGGLELDLRGNKDGVEIVSFNKRHEILARSLATKRPILSSH